MGLQFRKRIKVCKGVSLNIGKTGVSGVTVGKRGASISAGKRGVYANVGAPGTGLSYRHKLDSNQTGVGTPKRGLFKTLIRWACYAVGVWFALSVAITAFVLLVDF